MSDPYEVLSLPRNADEGETRRRYLELVRQFPPDRDPTRFAEIRAAYDEVRDPVRRLQNSLLEVDSGETITAVANEIQARLRQDLRKLPIETLLAMAETP
jgi:DnaJ-class molecular chaperone